MSLSLNVSSRLSLPQCPCLMVNVRLSLSERLSENVFLYLRLIVSYSAMSLRKRLFVSISMSHSLFILFLRKFFSLCYVSQEKFICLTLNVSFFLSVLSLRKSLFVSISMSLSLSLFCLSGKVYLSKSKCLSLVSFGF